MLDGIGREDTCFFFNDRDPAICTIIVTIIVYFVKIYIRTREDKSFLLRRLQK